MSKPELSAEPSSVVSEVPEVLAEKRFRAEVEVVLACTSTEDVSFDFSRMSTLNRAYRSIAWVLRFIRNLKKRVSEDLMVRGLIP